MVLNGPTQSMTEGNLTEQEGRQTDPPEQIKHELADSLSFPG